MSYADPHCCAAERTTARPAPLLGRRPAGRLLPLLAFIADCLEARRQRRALARLDAARLHDIGIDFEEARREAERPIWDAPRRWRN